MSRKTKRLSHNKQERMKVMDKAPTGSDMTDGVPVLAATNMGIEQYVKHNGVLYKQSFETAIPKKSISGAPDYTYGWFFVNIGTTYTFPIPWTFTDKSLPRVELWFNYTGGTSPVLGTDDIWKVNTGGDQGDLYMGIGSWIKYTADNEITMHTGEDYVFNIRANTDLSYGTGYMLFQAWK